MKLIRFSLPWVMILTTPEHQGRADEHGRGEGEQGLTDIELGRAGQQGRVAVHEGADGDQTKRDGDGLVQLGHVQGEGADGGARDHGGQDDAEQAHQLIRPQTHDCQEAHGAGRLFRQDDADQQDRPEQPQQIRPTQPSAC